MNDYDSDNDSYPIYTEQNRDLDQEILSRVNIRNLDNFDTGSRLIAMYQ